jgi:hypothetical protein
MNQNQNDTGVDGGAVTEEQLEQAIEQLIDGNEAGAAVSDTDSNGLDQAPVSDTDSDGDVVSDDEDPCADADEGAPCGA